MHTLFMVLSIVVSGENAGLALADGLTRSSAVVEARIVSVGDDVDCTIVALGTRALRGELPKERIVARECGKWKNQSKRAPGEDVPSLARGDSEVFFLVDGQYWRTLRASYWEDNSDMVAEKRLTEIEVVARCLQMKTEQDSAICFAKGLADERQTVRVASYLLAVRNKRLPVDVLAPAYVDFAERESGGFSNDAVRRAENAIDSAKRLSSSQKQGLRQRLDKVRLRRL